jgi:signal transduction histidine kinase
MRWPTTFSTGEAIVRRSFTSGKTVVYTVNTDAGLSGTPTGSKRTSGGTVGKSFDLSDAIAAPLICKGQAVGVLVLASQKRRPVFNKLQVCLVEALANQLAVAIENARLCKELLAEEAIRSEILQKLISAQEDERRRIARELHDETSQALTALIIGLETAEDSLPIDARDAKRHLESARLLTVQTLEEVRKIVMDLRPTLLDDLGLVPALRWYSRTQVERLALKLTFESRGLQGRLPPQLEVALFRIVQEAITNIARHAEARSVKVQLVRSGSSLVAVIEDDGKGFEVSEYFGEGRKSNGFGLLGMKERASVLGGTLEIHSRAGRGTRVTVTVPVSGTVQGSPLEVRPLVT